MDLHKYYIEKISAKGVINIWLVNGKSIRDNLDIEFTNYGQKFFYSYIPENEFWIDTEASQDERKYFVDRMLIEKKLIDNGCDTQTIKAISKNKESSERYKHEKHKKSQNKSNQVFTEKIKIKLLGITTNNLYIWLIKGKEVRTLFDVNFTEGGHDLVYNYVPTNEIWIDDDLVENERAFVILHELYERELMSKGDNYNIAHEKASSIEWESRHNTAKLAEFLFKLGLKI
ncbi:MAG: hypothetical protein WCO84_00855 [bacterium]